jgi:NADPH2:quinone reductase
MSIFAPARCFHNAGMTHIVRITHPGGPEQLELVEVPLPAPGPGELRLRQLAIGLNFVDVYHRTGQYPLPLPLPAVLGVEAVGVVEAVGPGVTGVAPGDRVAYAGALGAYATERVLPAWRAVPVPPVVSDAAAATLLTRGITVHMLQTKVFAVDAATTALVHSAAGGLGSMLVRAAKQRGATVIATVGSPAKAAIARATGADHVIVGRNADFVAAVHELTRGAGADVAYDGVGGATLAKTLACVRPFGTVASFGEAGGPIPPLAVEDIGPRRSLMFARPSVMQFMTDRDAYLRAAREVITGTIAPEPGPSYQLADAARAHRELESGTTTGAAVLIP